MKADFQKVNEARFKWQTQNYYIKRKEVGLLESISRRSGKILEIGCGEGANIYNLFDSSPNVYFIGIDLSYKKLSFAKRNNSGAKFICADVLNLPLKEDVFDLVFCRDLLHHIERQIRPEALREMYRVCRWGSEIVIIEGNGLNLLNRIFASILSSERGMKDRIGYFTDKIGEGYMYEPSNLFRVILHYGFGIPSLGNVGWVGKTLDLYSAILSSFWPRRFWAYMVWKTKKA